MMKISRGFSVIEYLLSLVVITFAMLSMFGLVSSSFGLTEQDSQRIQAVAVGQQYLDSLRQAAQNAHSLPAAPTVNIDPGFGQTGSQITSMQAFSLTNNGCPIVTGDKVMHNCVVTVSWTDSGASKSVTVQSYISEQ